MKLVENWRGAWKWYSTHAAALNIALLGTWAALPDKFQEAFSPLEIKAAAIALVVGGFAGRVIDQGGAK